MIIVYLFCFVWLFLLFFLSFFLSFIRSFAHSSIPSVWFSCIWFDSHISRRYSITLHMIFEFRLISHHIHTYIWWKREKKLKINDEISKPDSSRPKFSKHFACATISYWKKMLIFSPSYDKLRRLHSVRCFDFFRLSSLLFQSNFF